MTEKANKKHETKQTNKPHTHTHTHTHINTLTHTHKSTKAIVSPSRPSPPRPSVFLTAASVNGPCPLPQSHSDTATAHSAGGGREKTAQRCFSEKRPSPQCRQAAPTRACRPLSLVACCRFPVQLAPGIDRRCRFEDRRRGSGDRTAGVSRCRLPHNTCRRIGAWQSFCFTADLATVKPLR